MKEIKVADLPMRNWTKKKKVIVGSIAALAIFSVIGNTTDTEEEAPTAAVAAPETTEPPAPTQDTQEAPKATTEAPKAPRATRAPQVTTEKAPEPEPKPEPKPEPTPEPEPEPAVTAADVEAALAAGLGGEIPCDPVNAPQSWTCAYESVEVSGGTVKMYLSVPGDVDAQQVADAALRLVPTILDDLDVVHTLIVYVDGLYMGWTTF